MSKSKPMSAEEHARRLYGAGAVTASPTTGKKSPQAHDPKRKQVAPKATQAKGK